jgi:tape measure domain-containing protein
MDKNLEYKLSLKDLFSKTMNNAANSTSKMDSKMSALNSKIANTLGGVALGAGVVSFGKAVVDSLKNYEYFSASLKTLLHGDANAAKALQGQLVTLAKTTPFQLTEVQDASKQLMAYGFKAGDVVKTMRTLGDVSSGIGAPLGDIAYLYGTLKTSGRVTLMDLRQFAGRGIPIYETLAKRLKVTSAEIGKMATAGKISFKEIEGAFSDMTKEGGQFFNLMADQSKTVGGRLSNMADTWEQIKVNIGKSQTGLIGSTVSWADSMLNKINDVIAGANRMDEAFKKSGAQGYSMMENFNNFLFGGTQNDFINKNFTGGKGKMEMLERSTQNMYVKPAGRDKLSALTSDAQLKRLKVSYGKAFANKEIDKNEYQRSMGIFDLALAEIAGNLKNFSSKEGLAATAGGGTDANGDPKNGKSSKSLGTGTEVTGNRPQSLNITINDGLVKEMTISTTNMSEGSQQIKEMVSKALLEAVNDVNLMER